MITEEQAQQFAKNWIDAWNSHDIDAVISHYDDDIEYFSVFLTKLTNNTEGVLHGKENVKDYLTKGLQAYPDLHFSLKNIFMGVKSITLEYQSVNNFLAAEVFELNNKGLVSRVQCHYRQI
ncbi:MAG: nuclear transport factor 2 family protein [Gammaproteobacteria bacterium]|nr:nuclear transport factor 2 family protein [Gammaproteobacteria bacterium]